MSDVINIYFSHSWKYGDTYEQFIELIKGRINFVNYSLPLDDPVHDADIEVLSEAIKTLITPCNVVLIRTGVYDEYYKWINKEIMVTKLGFAKPKYILLVKPTIQTKPSMVEVENCDDILNWKVDYIVDSITRFSK